MPKGKKATYEKVLFVEDAPTTQKEKKKEHVGIIKNKKVRKHFVITAEDEENLKSFVHYAEKKLGFKVNDTKAIQILFRAAAKNPTKFIKLVKL